MEQHIVWSHLHQPGMEHLRLTQRAEEIHADGLIIAIVDNVPARVHYHIRCDAAWRVRELYVILLDELDEGNHLAMGGTTEIGGVPRAAVNPADMLHIYADGEGHWTTASGEALPALDGCIDVDISVTPFTNTLPIRRLHLPPGAAQEIVVAYIQIPEMALSPFKQRYTCLSNQTQSGIYRYDSVGSDFTADLSVDSAGLVIDYPGLFQRAWSSS